jgi:hypothetical protein
MTPADLIQKHLLWVQIAIGIVQIVTTVFFIKSVHITARQEEDAKEQIRLAREQTALTREQMAVMGSQFRESLRPLLIVTRKHVAPNFVEIEIRNDGLGPALEITCEPLIQMKDTVIGSKGSITAAVPQWDRSYSDGPNIAAFTLTYKSVDGCAYATSFVRQSDSFSVARYWNLS